MKLFSAKSLIAILILLFLCAVARYVYSEWMSYRMQSATIAAADEYFRAIRGNNRALVNELTSSSSNDMDLAPGYQSISGHVEFDSPLPPVEAPSNGQIPIRNISLLRKFLPFGRVPVAYATDYSEGFGASIVLRFDCTSIPPRTTCVEYQFVYFDDSWPLRVDSLMTVTNSPEWRRIFASRYANVLRFKPAENGLFQGLSVMNDKRSD